MRRRFTPAFMLETIRLGIALFVISLPIGRLAGQEYVRPSVHLKRAIGPIKLDGNLDEPSWFTGQGAKDFWQYFPLDSVKAIDQTEIYMTYDDEFLYVGVKAHAAGNDYIVPSLKRDYSAGGSDNISLFFDTFSDQTNAFMFGLNPYGVQREALISNGGTSNRDWASSWDNKWYSAAGIHDHYWVAEFAIPFKTLRFTEGSKIWRFNSYRFDTQQNERSTWIRMPRNQILFNLAFTGEMVWDEPLRKPGANVSVIPYVLGAAGKNHEDGDLETGYKWNAGGDAKIAVTPGLNLDLTVNPDFSQVEVDRQVTNLDRFEIFFQREGSFSWKTQTSLAPLEPGVPGLFSPEE